MDQALEGPRESRIGEGDRGVSLELAGHGGGRHDDAVADRALEPGLNIGHHRRRNPTREYEGHLSLPQLREHLVHLELILQRGSEGQEPR